MGRKIKYGLDYFPLDVDFFDDHKLLMIEEELGVKGGYLALRLMAMVYEQGYYLEWQESSRVSCAKRVGNGFTGSLVWEILDCCLKHGLFDREKFEKYGILTSNGIQKRWQEVMKLINRKAVVDERYKIISSEEKAISSQVIPISSEEMLINSEDMTQKKGKERKVKKIPKVEDSSSSSPPASQAGAGKVSEPFWDQIVETWFSFVEKKFGDRPSFKGPDPKALKKIIGLLKKRAEAKGVEWNEASAIERLTAFFDRAYEDPWLKGHFLLANLESQFDKIILNGTTHQRTSAGQSGSVSGGKSAGANQLAGMLKSELATKVNA